MDREKVIKGMEQFREDLKPFCGNHADWEKFDAGLFMLKEQEESEQTGTRPVVPERENSGSGMTWWNICGACKTAINPNDKYCHECGRAILWTGNGEKNNA